MRLRAIYCWRDSKRKVNDMYSLSKSLDFYWLVFTGSPAQRSPHAVQHTEFEAIAEHHSMAPDRIATAASDTRFLASVCLLTSLAFAGAAIGQHTDFWVRFADGILALGAFLVTLRLYRAGWRLRHRQMGGWWELALPMALSFRMRDPDGRGPSEVEA